MGDKDSFHEAEKWITEINAAEKRFRLRVGRYTSNVRELGPKGEGLLEKEYAQTEMFNLVLDLAANGDHYEIKVRPKTWFADGYTSFYVDQSGLLRRSDWPWVAGRNREAFYQLD